MFSLPDEAFDTQLLDCMIDQSSNPEIIMDNLPFQWRSPSVEITFPDRAHTVDRTKGAL